MSESANLDRPSHDGAAHFGDEVRALREALELSQSEFAAELHYNQGQVSKVETGGVLASEAFASAMDRVAGTPGVYLRMRGRLAKQRHPDWFVPYIVLEESASGITDYSCTFLMGLLQTPEYAAAVMRAAFPRESEEWISENVELRMQRQQVLSRPSPPLVWVIVHEAVLRAVVGGPCVMTAQLGHLLELIQSPHVILQVFPFDAGAAPSNLPFTLLALDEKPHAVYTETPTHGGQVDEAPDVVASAVKMFDRLRMTALSEEGSLALIRKIMEDHAK
ncbi:MULTISPECIES: helix-turn-helix domain-containing protein [unclassified Streptomyces]|uniref:helix-turn-helix domain-containing protein n=1 Tax=unclassified Streptomyces TaxID=2593676 RepID=UPI00037767EF|nr:helix-turn-helix transcriptional regulator [Streptomyces sp. LaPpAH-202]MYW56551.1 helix-turn-helix domain-containing protein [Streptomyces sp. SID8370]MYW88509.1 helix-turn-helix domain-containing protein [Streptomyces sp. SID8371]